MADIANIANIIYNCRSTCRNNRYYTNASDHNTPGYSKKLYIDNIVKKPNDINNFTYNGVLVEQNNQSTNGIVNFFGFPIDQVGGRIPSRPDCLFIDQFPLLKSYGFKVINSPTTNDDISFDNITMTFKPSHILDIYAYGEVIYSTNYTSGDYITFSQYVRNNIKAPNGQVSVKTDYYLNNNLIYIMVVKVKIQLKHLIHI